MRNIIISAAAVTALAVSSCSDWTTPEGLQDRYVPARVEDAAYLSALRAYKASDHLVTMVTIPGSAGAPTHQNQHPAAMADSADYIFVTSIGLHPSLAAEIPLVHKKGTLVLNVVDYMPIENDWVEMQEEGADPDPEGFAAYCAGRVDYQLSQYDKAGFDGIVISYFGRLSTDLGQVGQETFLECIDKWRTTHKKAILVARGYVQNLVDKSILDDCKYVIFPAGTGVSNNSMTLAVQQRLLAGVPSDRCILEIELPYLADPKQIGPTPAAAVAWMHLPNANFTKAGLSILNAKDYYYFSDGMNYRIIRETIATMNPNIE